MTKEFPLRNKGMEKKGGVEVKKKTRINVRREGLEKLLIRSFKKVRLKCKTH